MGTDALTFRVAVEHLAERWGIQLGASLPGASCSTVYEGFDASGQEVVLKLPWPNAEERNALSILKAFSGHGGISVLQTDQESGAVLLPRLRPGTSLAKHPGSDLDKVDIAADMILRLRNSPIAHGTPINFWLRELDLHRGNMAEEARLVAEYLLASSPPPRNLHGDLHHGNLLLDGDTWVAIDPKGMRGDPSHEVAAFMRNELPPNFGAAFVSRRLQRFSERLGDSPYRLWGWTFAQNVLSCLWNDPDPEHLERSEFLAALRECRSDFT